MHNTSLVVFANFRINNEERYLRLKDSFFSFKDISAEKWVINIRGSYKEQTKNFLQEHLQDKFHHYDIESKKGWFQDTRTMLKDIDTDLFNFNWHYGGRNLRFPRRWLIFPLRVLRFTYRKINQLLKN